MATPRAMGSSGSLRGSLVDFGGTGGLDFLEPVGTLGMKYPYTVKANLVADITFYPPQAKGRKSPIHPGYGCPSFAQKSFETPGWDCWPLIETPMAMGESRRVGVWFLSGEDAARVMREAGTFYLWEGDFIGEAKVVA
jgi:hypothetical protein